MRPRPHLLRTFYQMYMWTKTRTLHLFLMLSLLFQKGIKAQELAHVRGQYFGELAYQSSLIYEPGYSFLLSGGAYLGLNSSLQLALGRNSFFAFEEREVWDQNQGDSILFKYPVRLPYTSYELLALYSYKLLSSKERLLIKGLIGASFSLEKYEPYLKGSLVMGPEIGAELELFLASKFALISRYLLGYQPRSQFPSKSQIHLGLRLLISP